MQHKVVLARIAPHYAETLIARVLRYFWCGLALVGIVLFDRAVVPINGATAALLMLLAVLGAATLWGLAESVFTSVMAVLGFNFFFLPPVGTFTVADPENWVALSAFLVTALTVSRLSATAQRRALEATASRADIARLYELSRALLMDQGEDSIRQSVTRTARVLGVSSLVFFDLAEHRKHGLPPGDPFTDDDYRRVAITSEPAEAGNWVAIPVRLGSRAIGALGVLNSELSGEMRDSAASLLAINYERTVALARTAAAEAARRSEEFKSSLLDALAHDLKTPLTAIRTCITRLIAIPPRTEEVRTELLSIIDQESARLRLSITEAIELARVESGAVRPELQTVELRALVEGAPDAFVRADVSLMGRALAQLVENAHKYSPPGTEVTVEAGADREIVEIRVLDRGPGIALDEREHVFEKFYRGRGGRDKVEGTGMGLPIAKAIIEAHDGTIRAERRDGGGTAIVITLPRAPEPV